MVEADACEAERQRIRRDGLDDLVVALAHFPGWIGNEDAGLCGEDLPAAGSLTGPDQADAAFSGAEFVPARDLISKQHRDVTGEDTVEPVVGVNVECVAEKSDAPAAELHALVGKRGAFAGGGKAIRTREVDPAGAEAFEAVLRQSDGLDVVDIEAGAFRAAKPAADEFGGDLGAADAQRPDRRAGAAAGEGGERGGGDREREERPGGVGDSGGDA